MRATPVGFLRTLILALLLAAAGLPIYGAGAAGNGVGGTGAAANRSDNGGIGGTGATATRSDNSGIGGTGAMAKGSGDSGVGGTGAVARRSGSGIGGTGIVGTITAFGSIFVNGVEIHYGPHTLLQVDGHQAPLSRLAVGQVVAVDTTKTGNAVHAGSIRVLHAVAGPITRIDASGDRFQVLGQTVTLARNTPIIALASSSQAGTPLRVHDYVEVSGLRRSDGVIVASLVRRTPARAQVSVSGPVTAAGPFGLRVYGLTVPSGDLAGRAIADGTPVRVTGTWAQGRLKSPHVAIEPSIPFGGRLAHLDLEGYVKSRTGPENLRVGRVPLRLTPATRFKGGNAHELTVDRRVVISAHLDARQQLVVDRVDFQTGLPGIERSSAASTGSRASDRDDTQDRSNQPDGATADQPDASDRGPAQPSVDKPELDRPDVEVPEIERPDIARPEIESPD